VNEQFKYTEVLYYSTFMFCQ